MKSKKEKIKELAKKGMKKKEIEQELHVLYGASSLKSRAIYKYIAETKFSPEVLEEHDKPGRKIDSQLLNRIQEVLAEMPFASSYIIADTLNETQNIVYRYLTNYLGLVYKQSLWIPHELNFQQKKDRVTKTKEILSVLEKSKHQGWRDIITGDQSWFVFYYGRDGKWCLPEEKKSSYEWKQFN